MATEPLTFYFFNSSRLVSISITSIYLVHSCCNTGALEINCTQTTLFSLPFFCVTSVQNANKKCKASLWLFHQINYYSF